MSERETVMEQLAHQIRKGKARGGGVSLTHKLSADILALLATPPEKKSLEPEQPTE